MPIYVQPIARHLVYPERFLLRGEDGGWYVWTGTDAESSPEKIAASTAGWLLERRWIIRVPPTAWVHIDDLPLAARRDPSRRVG